MQRGIEIVGVTSDSRKVKPGFLFVAIAGSKTDGAHFVRQAASGGAVAVAAEHRPNTLPDAMAFIRAANPRRLLALTAAKIFPRQPATIAAVTGTSGKTSVAAFTRQIWSQLGYRAASIGTVGVVSPAGERYGSLTTPDPVELHRTLDQLAKEGVTHLALEASSHGLDQHRSTGCASQLVHLQTCHEIISIITPASRPTSQPSSACSSIWLRQVGQPLSASTIAMRTRWLRQRTSVA